MIRQGLSDMQIKNAMKNNQRIIIGHEPIDHDFYAIVF